MALFRFHRGGLAESLATTVIVNNRLELRELIEKSFDKFFGKASLIIDIQPYPEPTYNFDARIGWYTQMVKGQFLGQEEFVAGFLSEPLEH